MLIFNTDINQRFAARHRQAHTHACAIVAHAVTGDVHIIVVVVSTHAIGGALEVAATRVWLIRQAGCHLPTVVEVEVCAFGVEAWQRGELGVLPRLISEIELGSEAIVVSVANTHAVGRRDVVFATHADGVG